MGDTNQIGQFGWARFRTITAWLTLLAFVSAFVADNAMDRLNPLGNAPWPSSLEMPVAFKRWLLIRNAGLLVALVAGVVSLPRWQSIVGLAITIIWFAIRYYQFATY